jgi:tRNA(Ile)-lysidine synthase TilS/MesJ
MIKLLVPLPKKLTIACSGGVDSMAVVDFLKRKHDVTIAYFNHGTKHGSIALTTIFP